MPEMEDRTGGTSESSFQPTFLLTLELEERKYEVHTRSVSLMFCFISLRF